MNKSNHRRHVHFRIPEQRRDMLLSSLRNRGIGWQHFAEAVVEIYFEYEQKLYQLSELDKKISSSRSSSNAEKRKNAAKLRKEIVRGDMYTILSKALAIRAAAYQKTPDKDTRDEKPEKKNTGV